MANMRENRTGRRRTAERKPRVPLKALVCYLLLVAVVFSSAALARYNTTAYGTATARVAKFNVTASADGEQANSIELTAGDANSNGAYSFSVTNSSEVLVKYSVVVSGVPANVQVSLGKENLTSQGTGALTFTARELAMGATESCSLTFHALDGAETATVDVNVQVHVEQVD